MAVNLPNLQFSNTNNSQFNNIPNPTMNMNYQPQSIFMQPIGNIYGMSSSSEVGNIPIGNGVSMGLCLNEGIMYLKSMQNNGPVLLGYKISPLENTQRTQVSENKNNTDLSKIEDILKSYESRFAKIEQQLGEPNKKTGGKTEWQL